MQAHGNTTVPTSYGGQELSTDESKWFLVWVAVWMIALAALLPALI